MIARRRRREEEQLALGEARPEHQLLVSLQQSAGNRAVSAELQRLRRGSVSAARLQRRVKIGKNLKTAPWMKKDAALPKLPDAFKIGRTSKSEAGYQANIVAAAMKVAAAWRNDAVEQGREFLTVDAFYEAVFNEVITRGAAATTTAGKAWPALKVAVNKPDGFVELPWATFAGVVGTDLEAELSACDVQRSNNSGTTACHANKHNKLPKKIVDAERLAALPANQQWPRTPYIEFLVTSHKSDTEIERAVLDRDADQIYITAHYDKGSFVWLSGAPPTLVNNWKRKATAYKKEIGA